MPFGMIAAGPDLHTGDGATNGAASPWLRRWRCARGRNRGEIHATLHGELGTIVSRTEAQAVERFGNAKLPQLALREFCHGWLRG